MTTVRDLLLDALDGISSPYPNSTLKAMKYLEDAIALLDQGYDVEANTSYTVPENVNEIFEIFADFKACVISAFPDTPQRGEFINASEAFAEEDPKRCVYYWGSKDGTDFIEYDTGTVKNFRWTIYYQYRRGYGATFGEAIDNLYTRPMLNQ